MEIELDRIENICSIIQKADTTDVEELYKMIKDKGL